MPNPARCVQLFFLLTFLINFWILVYIRDVNENVTFLMHKMDRLLAEGNIETFRKGIGRERDKDFNGLKSRLNNDGLDSFRLAKGDEPARIRVDKLHELNSWMKSGEKTQKLKGASEAGVQDGEDGKAYRVVKVPGGKDFRIVKVEEVPQTKPNQTSNTFGSKSGIESYLPMLDGENIISMSLWGRDRRYTVGAVRNAELIREFFPGWKMRIYTEAASDHRMFEAIPKDIVEKLKALHVDIEFVNPAETRIPPMMWRFMIADDLSVDRFLIRDTDSRLSARDAATVWAWEQSGKALQCIRDHPSHANYALNGGLWGGKPAALRSILRRPWSELMYGYKKDYLQDMVFLQDVIWPRVKAHVYCSDSQSCEKWPGSHPFPIRRYGYEHIGQVYNANDLSRPIDIRIMREVKDNPKCVPPV